MNFKARLLLLFVAMAATATMTVIACAFLNPTASGSVIFVGWRDDVIAAKVRSSPGWERGQQQASKGSTGERSTSNNCNVSQGGHECLIQKREILDDGSDVWNGANYVHNSPYRITINAESICTSESVFLLVIVCSRPSDANRRDMFRRTWGSVLYHKGHAVRTIFILGTSWNSSVQEHVNAESSTYGDLLQFEMLESYKNLTLKTMLGLKWAKKFCTDALFVMKTDDDVVVLYKNLIDYLLSLRVEAARFLYVGHLHSNTMPIRDVTDKWYVGVGDYGGLSFPPYAGGSGYVLSMTALKLVVRASYGIKYLHLEDAFVGMCADKAGFLASGEEAFHGYWLRYSDCRYRKLITSHGWYSYEIESLWKSVMELEKKPRPTKSTCPPFEWLLSYYDYTDEDVDKVYQQAVKNNSEIQ